MMQFFSDNLWLIWLLVGLLCLIAELGFGDMFLLCFAIGSVCSAIAAALGMGLMGQIFTLVVFSILSVCFVRPVALRYLHKGEDKRVSGTEALIGRIGEVSEDIPAGGYGRVKIDGDDWKSVSTASTGLPRGAKVRVVSMESIILTVEPAD